MNGIKNQIWKIDPISFWNLIDLYNPQNELRINVAVELANELFHEHIMIKFMEAV